MSATPTASAKYENFVISTFHSQRDRAPGRRKTAPSDFTHAGGPSGPSQTSPPGCGADGPVWLITVPSRFRRQLGDSADLMVKQVDEAFTASSRDTANDPFDRLIPQR